MDMVASDTEGTHSMCMCVCIEDRRKRKLEGRYDGAKLKDLLLPYIHNVCDDIT